MGAAMNEHEDCVIPAQENVKELTLRVIIIAIFLTVVLALSNAYLALKIGLLTSASIPAAIISMGILHFFKDSTILENNCVQTAASAGEAVAGGIVYTVPALIIIRYWHHFDYWTNFFIAAIGGILGVLFSIPLRRILVKDKRLKFPEGKAIAEVLKTSMTERVSLKEIIHGGIIGGLLELCQMGFKLIASSWSIWFVAKRMLFGFGAGFSATMIGAGYLIGFEMALSICIGAIIAWVFALPIVSEIYPSFTVNQSATHAVMQLWNAKVRYLGIGAMLFAGVWTLIILLKPLAQSIKSSLHVKKNNKNNRLLRTNKDIPIPFLLIGIFFIAAVLFLFFQFTLPLGGAGIDMQYGPTVVFFCVIFVLVIGFLFSVITGYFSGMVGVSASPGSSIIIAGMLLAACLLVFYLTNILGLNLSSEQVRAAEAVTIIVGAVVTGIAAIANDNVQDLKVGYFVGATPWKQQLMLLLGVVVSALVIPPIMQLLFDVYGIAGVMPHDGMDASQSLPAPPAALMAAITRTVFSHSLPWNMFFSGGLIILVLIVVKWFYKLPLSILGVAIGIYLPIASSFPLFLGGVIAWFVNHKLKQKGFGEDEMKKRKQKGILLACGLLAGAAIMDVLLAIPFSIFHSPDALRLVGIGWAHFGVILAIVTTYMLGYWFYYITNKP
jgi:putative OPT family oligopeptide transporter